MAKRKHDQSEPEPEDKAAERLRQFHDARYPTEESQPGAAEPECPPAEPDSATDQPISQEGDTSDERSKG